MKRYLLSATAAAAMTLFVGASSATTVYFTKAESPGVSCCGPVSSTAWAAYGISSISSAYWYADGRDLFDTMGLSVSPCCSLGTAVLELATASATGVTVDYWSISGNSVKVSVYDSAHSLLGSAGVGGPVDSFGTTSFAGAVKFVEWTGNGGFAQISTLTFGVPEPQTYALMLAGLGIVGFMARRRKV